MKRMGRRDSLQLDEDKPDRFKPFDGHPLTSPCVTMPHRRPHAPVWPLMRFIRARDMQSIEGHIYTPRCSGTLVMKGCACCVKARGAIPHWCAREFEYSTPLSNPRQTTRDDTARS